MGNERQRKAIDGLREQVVFWAVQDLRMKREELAQGITINDPLDRLNKIVSKAFKQDVDLRVIESYEEPNALFCSLQGLNKKCVLSPLSPNTVKKLRGQKSGRLSISHQNPLTFMPKQVEIYEFSILNSSIMIDVELPIIWKALTNQEVKQMEILWMYVF